MSDATVMLAEVESVLGPGGPIAARLGPDFESRPEQLRMARAVAHAMEQRAHLLAEAGTGVGKSFAYLVPAVLRALRRGEIVVVATNTISLQEQLVERDIPLLAALLDPDDAAPTERTRLRPVLVKGRGNYVSIRRLELASKRQDKLFGDPAARRSLHVIEDWALTTTDGTLSTLPQLERGGVWDKVQSDSGNCMGRRCPTYEQCFYQRARRTMEQGNLLICNHALFFADLALRAQDAGFLPRYDHVVLDEAHMVEDVAAEHFGLSLSEARLNHLLATLYQQRTGKGFLPQLQLVSESPEPLDRAVRAVLEALEATRQFFGSLLEWAQSRSLPAGGRIRAPGIVPNVITPALNELTLRLRALKDDAKAEADKYELNAYVIRAQDIAHSAESLVEQALPGCAYWLEIGARDDGPRSSRVELACSPIDVAPILKERLFTPAHSVILTSATLATRTVGADEATERAETAFALVMGRLGCEGAATLQLGSPFDHASQMELHVATHLPNPRDSGGSSAYLEALCACILDHLAATDGGAFILFTSFASLNAAARHLRPKLTDLGMPMYAQGLDGSRTEILERFRSDERSVLLGAASFWQGVDVRGRALRNVIITRLPFDPPDRPLTEARLEAIRDRGGDPFREDSLPRAIIRFKQGFGRLIRSRRDTGRVVVLDPRIVTTGYGRQFLTALPEGVRIVR